MLRVVGPGAARSDAARPGLSLLTTILGGSFTSRLNANLREKHGYTYGAGARIDFLRRPGAFVVASSVFAKVTDAALRELLAEIGGLRSGPVTAEELRKARALLQQQIAENLATTEGTVGLYADLAAYDRPADDPARFVAALGRADAAALRLLAARAIDEGALTIVAVGDRKTVEPALRALGLPAPEIRDADGAVVK